jgi:NTP pyrophosphatase (non-canonical NTP hydrolase)
MEIKEITGRNYYATKKRGQINDKTNILDFIVKLDEEKEELYQSWFDSDKCLDYDIKELADIVLVCFAMAKHTGKDLLSAMEQKMLFNEKRLD